MTDLQRNDRPHLKISSSKLAHEYFPYAGLSQSLTISGLIDKRYGSKRMEWARVLQGSDEQLADFVRTHLWSAVNHNCEEIASFHLALWLVKTGNIENVVERRITIKEMSLFYAGWRASRLTDAAITAERIKGRREGLEAAAVKLEEERLSDEEYGHGKAAVALCIEAIRAIDPQQVINESKNNA